MKKVYLASPFFKPHQIAEVEQLENLLGSYSNLNLISPRKVFNCPPTATQEVRQKTYEGNIYHISTSDFIVVNTADYDAGTIFEAGFAAAIGKPIIFYCSQLKPGAQFNLMLAQVATKVCVSLEELKEYIDEVDENERKLEVFEPYSGEIE